MDDKTYQIYDGVILFLVRDIAKKIKEAKVISLDNFEPKNKEHLIVFNCALIVASLQRKKVAVNLPLLKFIKLKFTQKTLRKIFKNKSGEINFNVASEVDAVYASGIDLSPFEHGFGCIYDEYYA